MKYYANYDTRNGTLFKSQCEYLTDFIVNIEIPQEVYENLNLYKYDGSTIVAKSQEEIDRENIETQRVDEIAEIKFQLETLDLKSIRALRSGDSEYIEQYEQEAQTLRVRLQELMKGV